MYSVVGLRPQKLVGLLSMLGAQVPGPGMEESQGHGWGSWQCSQGGVPRAIAPCTQRGACRRGCPAPLDIDLLLPSRAGTDMGELDQVAEAAVRDWSSRKSIWHKFAKRANVPMQVLSSPGKEQHCWSSTSPTPARGYLEGKTSPVSETSLCKTVVYVSVSETVPLLHRELDRQELRSRAHIKGRGMFTC